MTGETSEGAVSQQETLPIRVTQARLISAPPAQSAPVQPSEPPRSFLGRAWHGFKWLLEGLFGTLIIVGGLAILAVIPLVQFLSLGYFFEATGRVARSGRLRDGLIGIRKAARIGSVVLGVWIVLAPLRFLSSLFVSARVMEPDSPRLPYLGGALLVFTLFAGFHIAMACARGGRLRYFLWPFGNPVHFYRRWREGGLYGKLRDQFWDFTVSLRLPYYFWLGFRGFFGSLIWLFIPISLLAAGTKAPGLGWIGGLLLVWVVLVLPLLQAQFAVENRFRAHFALATVRERFRHAPFACYFALSAALLFPLPLYLLKVELVAAEAGWLPSVFFIGFMLPSRLLTGWAYGRAMRRETRAHWFWRLFLKPGLLPVAGFYVLMVFFSQYLSWEGIGSLYGQHAFLLPVPFAEFGQY